MTDEHNQASRAIDEVAISTEHIAGMSTWQEAQLLAEMRENRKSAANCRLRHLDDEDLAHDLANLDADLADILVVAADLGIDPDEVAEASGLGSPADVAEFLNEQQTGDEQALRHSERFRRFSNRYPHRVAEAYAGNLGRAMADSDEQVAATVADWEKGRALSVRDWAAVGREEREEADETERDADSEGQGR